MKVWIKETFLPPSEFLLSEFECTRAHDGKSAVFDQEKIITQERS